MILGAEHADREQIERFRIEAETVARLSHPNIVQIYEIGEHNGLPYVSLELIDGGDLRDATHTLQPARSVAQITRDLALGVAVAHAQGIVHRDLKSSNVLLADPPREGAGSRAGVTGDGSQTMAGSTSTIGRSARSAEPSTWYSGTTGEAAEASNIGRVPVPKITDFGLARQLDSESEHTRTGDILGTPSYMAPEQAAGLSKDVGPLADVYALGAILYALLTGRPPFSAVNVIELLDQVRNEEPVPPSKIVRSVPVDGPDSRPKSVELDPVVVDRRTSEHGRHAR